MEGERPFERSFPSLERRWMLVAEGTSHRGERPQRSQPRLSSWLMPVPSPRPTPDPEGRGSCRELVTEPSLGRPIASNIQSDIIWLQFPETKFRQRKFRMLLQSSKRNRGEGQKMDHKRIFVTQSQRGKTGMSSTQERRPGAFCPLTIKGDRSSLGNMLPQGFPGSAPLLSRTRERPGLSTVS